MAWCVGSVFPTPDLLTGSAFDFPVVDALDPPRHLFGTGCTFRYESFPEAEPHQQVDSFLENYREAFFPKDILCQHLQEDVSLHAESSQSCLRVGNRLEGIQNREGALQLFFPFGENADQLGSCLLPLGIKSSGRISNDDGNGMLYSSSLPVRQPIVQISANKPVSPGDSKLACVPLAVRTPYQVHWLMSRFQDNDVRLVPGGVKNFDYSTSHVVWNPHLSGEAVIILRNGDVSVFDLTSGKANIASFRFQMQDCNMDNLSSSYPTACIKRKRRNFSEPKFATCNKNLWSCEYAWHPRNLLVGGGTKIDLIDLRQKAGSKQFQCCLANAPSNTRLFSNCKSIHKEEHFTAIARGAQDDVFQFAAASTNHLTLFDIRQPKTPLLQWEHRMLLEPPGLLQIRSLSDTYSNLRNPYDKRAAGGRIILACAFRSGVIQAFPYGPQPKTYPQKAERHLGDLGVAEKVFSWDFPIKLTTPKAQSEKNLEHVFEAHGNNLQTLLSTESGVERLVGLISCSLCSESSTFTLVQLTGSGSILSQSLHVMEEQGVSTSEQSSSTFKKGSFAQTSPGRRGTKHYRMEYIPGFLTFLQDEAVFPKLKQKAYLSAAVNNVSTPWGIELKENEAEKELHRPYVMPGPILEELDNMSGETQNKAESTGTGDFFRELDSTLSPVNLSFERAGASLQSDELVFLTSLKNDFQQWQQSFQPYATHCNLDIKKTARSL